jgi:hypothetical protein
VAPLLGQLTTRARFADLAADLATVQNRIAAALVPLPGSPAPALRLGGGVALLPGLVDATPQEPQRIAQDRASGLTLIRLSDPGGQAPTTWVAERLDQPRYLLAASAEGGRVFARPVLVGALEEQGSPLWSGRVWALRGATEIPDGTFLFTGDGYLVGLTVDAGGTSAIVPAATLLAEAERVRAAGNRGEPGLLGVEVAELTPALARATGTGAGVVVRRVDAGGPAARALQIGDVVQRIDGADVRGLADWHVRAARAMPGQTLRLDIRSQGKTRIASIAVAPLPRPDRASLGMELQRATGGTEVVRVEPGSAGAAAGLRDGDLLVQIGAVQAPSPARVRSTFAGLPEGGAVVAGLVRDGQHLVVSLEKNAPSDR